MKSRSRIFKVVVAFLAIFAAWVFVAPLIARYLIVERPLAKADAILVLGGSSAYLERTQKAADLYNQGISPKILLTNDGEKAGWSQTEERNPPYVELARKVLIGQGVPAAAIEMLEPKNSGTFYEAEALREKSMPEHLTAVLIVTSAYHTRRALWVFEKEFAENNTGTVIGIEAALTGKHTPSPYTWWLSLHGWRAVVGEYVKFVYYWVFY